MNELIAIENKNSITSKEIAEITGKEHKSVIRDIKNLMEQLGNADGYSFVPTSYIDNSNRNQPMFLLNKKASLLLASGYNVVLRAKIIDRWEELENSLKPQLPQDYLSALKALVASEEEKQLLVSENKMLVEDNAHKQEVIEDLVDDVSLASKRQRITQIIRYKSNKYAERYNLLYKEYDRMYHCNTKTRLKNEKENGTIGKSVSQMDYICDNLNKTAQLYDVCVKVFETDFICLLQELSNTTKR